MNTNEKRGKRVVIALFLATLFLFVVLILSFALRNYKTDPTEFHNGYTVGFIRGYIEPVTNDDMYVYIILSDRQYATKFEVLALPKDIFDSFDDNLKRIVDSRETGCLLSLSIAFNEAEFDNLGYSYITGIVRYQTDAEGGDEISLRLYNLR